MNSQEREKAENPENKAGDHRRSSFQKKDSRKEVFLDLLGLRRAASSNTFSRKEVFQPHLPVRLPCYDLAPITSFALDRFDPSRQAPPAFMA